jgi:hypothetical protein
LNAFSTLPDSSLLSELILNGCSLTSITNDDERLQFDYLSKILDHVDFNAVCNGIRRIRSLELIEFWCCHWKVILPHLHECKYLSRLVIDPGKSNYVANKVLSIRTLVNLLSTLPKLTVTLHAIAETHGIFEKEFIALQSHPRIKLINDHLKN